jgi:outer membrane protein assembly factor BamB
LRFHLIAAGTLILLFVFGAAATADEVVLKNGGVIRGTITTENDREVVIQTDLGPMKVSRSQVREIRRDGGAEPPMEGTTPAAGKKSPWVVPGIDPKIVPVVASQKIFAVTKDGNLAAWPLNGSGGQEPSWSAGEWKGRITGIAADPGGVYLVTSDGRAARVYPASGKTVWRANPGGSFAGAPLLFRRGLFAFQPNAGLVGIETANGKVQGRLKIPVELATPLAAAGASIVFGEREGRLISVSDKGRQTAGAVRTDAPFRGRAPAVWLNEVAITNGESLLTYDTGEQKVTRTKAVSGLRGQPFAASPKRVYAEVDGALAAIDPANGRIVWRCYDVPRVIAITIAGADLLALTADNTLAWLSNSSGRVRGSVALGSRPAGPAIYAGGRALVPLRNGTIREFEKPVGTAAAPVKRAPPRKASQRTVRSPDGYAIDVPGGWYLSEQATRGAVSLGFRPNPQAPQFDLKKGMEQRARVFEATSYLAILVVPAPKTSLKEQAARYLEEEKAAAKQGGFEVRHEKTNSMKAGGHEWLTIGLMQAVKSDNLKGNFQKLVMVRALDGKRNVWLEAKVPETFAKAAANDLLALAKSFRAEKPADFTPPPEVVVAEAFVRALDRKNVAQALEYLSEPLRVSFKTWLPPKERRRLRLMMRASLPRGQRLEVRVRIDTMSGTKFTGITVAREDGKWVVIDVGDLMK